MTVTMKNPVRFVSFVLLVLFAAAVYAEPRNVIVMIGDGMGPEHVKAAGLYAFGDAYPESEKFCFEMMPYQGMMTTHSANNPITDSAASATAMATGQKVDGTVISMAFHPNIHWKERGRPLETILEYYQKQGKETGLVSTCTITHATPAGFSAHEPTRYNYDDIGHDILTQTRPTVLLGGGGSGMTPEKATQNGYYVVTSQAAMLALDTSRAYKISGQFGKGNLPYEFDEDYTNLPHLSEMTETAIKVLANGEQGFFLMVEGGRIDHAGHSNALERNVYETLEFAKAVQVAIDFASQRDDTLVVVTADHETGGMKVIKGNGQGKFPEVTWSTKGHTAAHVTVSAMGPNADQVRGLMDNTDIYRIAKGEAVTPQDEKTEQAAALAD